MCVAGRAFRINTLVLRDPHVFVPNDVIIFGCNDITNNGIALAGVDAINTSLMESLTNRTFNPVLVFNPLNQTAGTTDPLRVLFATSCSTMTPTCTAGTPPPVDLASSYTNGSGGACLAPVPMTTTMAYTPAVPTVTGAGCFSSASVPTLNVPFQLEQGTLNIPLQNVQVAAIYGGTPATGLMSGLLRGFLSEANAAATTLPAGLPLIGGRAISVVFKRGTGNACTAGADDRDLLNPAMPMGASNPRGWWFYLIFTAQQITLN
jgi:hypothetical protein